MSKRGIIRQGDLLLVPIESIPSDLKPASGEVVLATGERHGHRHAFDLESGVIGFFKEGDDNTMAGGTALVGGATPIAAVLIPTTGADLLHLGGERPDHAPAHAEPGAYEVRRQREYVAEGIERAVVD